MKDGTDTMVMTPPAKPKEKEVSGQELTKNWVGKVSNDVKIPAS